jgi:hypothetical protein
MVSLVMNLMDYSWLTSGITSGILRSYCGYERPAIEISECSSVLGCTYLSVIHRIIMDNYG